MFKKNYKNQQWHMTKVSQAKSLKVVKSAPASFIPPKLVKDLFHASRARFERWPVVKCREKSPRSRVASQVEQVFTESVTMRTDLLILCLPYGPVSSSFIILGIREKYFCLAWKYFQLQQFVTMFIYCYFNI